MADLNTETTLQKEFFNSNYKELNDLLEVPVYNDEMEWFRLREGSSFDDSLLDGYLSAVEYTYDRASYKVLRRLWDDSMEQYRIEVNNLMDKHYTDV